MTIVSLKAESGKGNGAVRIDFSDGSSYLFTPEYLPEKEKNLVLAETGRELTPETEESFRFAADCFRAEKIALNLVARAEQNSLGLTAKLERRGFDSSIAKAVVSSFEGRNLLDNRRYAELWIRSRLALKKAVSPRWLLVSLGKKGINGNLSRKVLNGVLDPETEYALLQNYIEKTGVGRPGFSLKAQLKYAGFSSDALNMYFNE